jgi:hypothetical protein
MRVLLIGLAMVAAAPAAIGQQTPSAESCAAGAAPALPAELAAWSKPLPLKAANAASALASARLTPGAAAAATLYATDDVAYPVQPEKPGGSVSKGGLFELDVATAGTYGVALSTPAWIDVLAGGKSVASTAHGRGPACTGVRKIVDFALPAGRHVIQISGNPGPDLTILAFLRP